MKATPTASVPEGPEAVGVADKSRRGGGDAAITMLIVEDTGSLQSCSSGNDQAGRGQRGSGVADFGGSRLVPCQQLLSPPVWEFSSYLAPKKVRGGHENKSVGAHRVIGSVVLSRVAPVSVCIVIIKVSQVKLRNPRRKHDPLARRQRCRPA